MLAAIEFDYEFTFSTTEIGNIVSNRKLTAKLQTVQLLRFKPSPKGHLRIGLSAAQAARASKLQRNGTRRQERDLTLTLSLDK